jgi:hypothetical protein
LLLKPEYIILYYIYRNDRKSKKRQFGVKKREEGDEQQKMRQGLGFQEEVYFCLRE